MYLPQGFDDRLENGRSDLGRYEKLFCVLKIRRTVTQNLNHCAHDLCSNLRYDGCRSLSWREIVCCQREQHVQRIRVPNDSIVFAFPRQEEQSI